MINFNGGKLQYWTFFTKMLLVFLFFLSLQDKGGNKILQFVIIISLSIFKMNILQTYCCIISTLSQKNFYTRGILRSIKIT